MRARRLTGITLLATLVAACVGPEPERPADSRQPSGVEATGAPSATPLPPLSATAQGPSPEEIRALLLEQIKKQGGPTAPTTNATQQLPKLDEIACDKKFCIRAVNDGLDPFDAVDPTTLPAGVTIERENVPLGAQRSVVRSFLAWRSPGTPRAKTEAELIKRFGSTLPSDHVLLFQLGPEGQMRSYIGGPGLLNTSHLAKVTAEPDTFNEGYRVGLKLTDDGKARFAAATEAMARRRIAIVVGGEAKTVPVVMERIPGGMAFISVTDKREADALAKALSP